MTERLNKILSQRGVCSRREADRLIADGRVFVNGQRAQVGDKVLPNDEIEVNGLPIDLPNKNIYIMLNKPVGIICTSDHDKPDNVIDYVGLSERVFPVGRLDVESSGLLLLTNDGDLANKLTHPRYGHEKEYEVHLDYPITDEQLKQMRQGMRIDDGPTQPCKVKRISKDRFAIVLNQGRNRQIRRMCEALRLNVTKLCRSRIHTLKLGRLPSGHWRELSKKELQELKN